MKDQQDYELCINPPDFSALSCFSTFSKGVEACGEFREEEKVSTRCVWIINENGMDPSSMYFILLHYPPIPLAQQGF